MSVVPQRWSEALLAARAEVEALLREAERLGDARLALRVRYFLESIDAGRVDVGAIRARLAELRERGDG